MFIVGVFATVMVGLSPLAIAISFPLFVVVRFIGVSDVPPLFKILSARPIISNLFRDSPCQTFSRWLE